MSEWISVKEQLPEHDQTVLVTDGKVHAVCIFFDGLIVEKQLAAFGAKKEGSEKYYFASLEIEGMVCHATHWMELPQLPE